MGNQEEYGWPTRLMAMICTICPMCIIARRWPKSRARRRIDKIRKRCIFCKAYAKVKHVPITAEEEAEQAIPIRRG